jgi:hypothetical protein
VATIIEEAGGIVEESELMSLLATRNRQRDEWVMDRKTINKSIDQLMDRGAVKRTKVALDNLGRALPKVVVYRSDIDLGSSQMVDFLNNLRALPQQPNRPHHRRDVGELNVEAALPPSRSQRPKNRLPLDAAPEAVQEYFAAEWRIVAQHYGFIYGRFARSRFFHLHLLRTIATSNSSSVVSRSNPRILRTDYFYNDLPLQTYLRVIPLSNLATELDNALADPIMSQTPIADLSSDIQRLLNPKKKREKMANVLEILSELRALIGLVPTSSSTATSITVKDVHATILCETTKDVRKAQYWILPEDAPVYAFSRDAPEKPIVGVFGLHDEQEGAAFWDKVEAASLGKATWPVAGNTKGFPSFFDGSKHTATAANVQSKWQLNYFMLNRQQAYLSRLMRRGELDLEEEGYLRQLSELTLAPIEAVKEFLQAGRTVQPTKPREVRERRSKTEEKAETKIARKAKNATRQRQKDWDALIKRFHDTSDGVQLDERTHELLRDWFVRPNGINATQLNEHLSTWLALQREGRAIQTAPSAGLPDPSTQFHQIFQERSVGTGKQRYTKRRKDVGQPTPVATRTTPPIDPSLLPTATDCELSLLYLLVNVLIVCGIGPQWCKRLVGKKRDNGTNTLQQKTSFSTTLSS